MSRNESQSSRFVIIETVESQFFPQCVKYLFDQLSVYLCKCNNVRGTHKLHERTIVKEGFVSYACDFVHFDVDAIESCTPEDLDLFAECANSPPLALLLKDRWFKGDFDRLKRIVIMNNRTKLLRFIENCMWERNYEDYYTLGQQLSIRMTTNLIQSGLDFKHHTAKDNSSTLYGRGWKCDEFEKILLSIKSVADITKRYKCTQTYVMLEIDSNNVVYAKSLLNANFLVITNDAIDNVCLIKSEGGSAPVLERLQLMIEARLVNVLFVTDTENYLHTHAVFYVYNSMKFYYYCLKNKFVFYTDDYETLYFVYTIVMLEIVNGGCLNSFTLEKSPVMHPLELNSRRCNALKRAAAYNKTVHNDMELKVDFIKGKRITTGSHDPNRILCIRD
nr:P47 [Darna trima granulovirus]